MSAVMNDRSVNCEDTSFYKTKSLVLLRPLLNGNVFGFIRMSDAKRATAMS